MRRASLAAQAKEKRIEELRQKAIRRIGNQGLMRGWTCWHEIWAEATRQKRMLAAASARLAKPALTAAVTAWRQDWQAEVEAARGKSFEVRLRESEAARDTAQAQLEPLKHKCAALEGEIGEIREQMSRQHKAAAEKQKTALERLRIELTGSEEERAAAKAAAEKERRLEQMHKKAALRLGNQGLLRGWTMWHDQYQHAARHKRMLAAASSRLAKPGLTSGFAHWRNDWQAEAALAIVQAKRQSLQGQKERVRELEARLKAEREDHERLLAKAAEKGATALERLRIELTGSEEQRAAAREAAEKEKRVEQLHTKAARRITNQGIMRGWTAWHDQYQHAARHKRMLAAASSRLAKPALTASVGHWRSDWEAARRREIAEKVRREQKARYGPAAEQELAALRAEMEQKLAQTKQSAEEHEKKALEKQRVELTGSAEEILALKAAEEKEKRVEQLHTKAARRIPNQGIMRGWTAWHDQYQHAARHKRMLAAASSRLARPALAASVGHWRSDWEAERRHALAQDARDRAKVRGGPELPAVPTRIHAPPFALRRATRASLCVHHITPDRPPAAPRTRRLLPRAASPWPLHALLLLLRLFRRQAAPPPIPPARPSCASPVPSSRAPPRPAWTAPASAASRPAAPRRT